MADQSGSPSSSTSSPASPLPASPDLDHLKKQAKRLLRAARAGEPDAFAHFTRHLPALRGRTPERVDAAALRLADAQSAVARVYGFRSWAELARHVAWQRGSVEERRRAFTQFVLEGTAAELAVAVRILAEDRDLIATCPMLAAMSGDTAAVEATLARDPGFATRPTNPFHMTPLTAVAHSRLILEAAFEAPLLACATLLLRHGADPDATWTDPRWPGHPLSTLYGAAGRTQHPGMTRLLLEAGARPDDGESLYHSLDGGTGTCTKLLLDAGARVPGTNALGRVLDFDRLDLLHLLLDHGGDPNEAPWIHHAIRRGRSLAHVTALLEAGADPEAVNAEGISLIRWAWMHGRADVAELLRAHGVEASLSPEETFVSAAARGDLAAARAVRERIPDIFARLSADALGALPRLAAVGDEPAVRTLLALGWPLEVKAEWDATALNLAVFQGNAALARLLLQAGADWRTRHGFGDTVLGTLSFASRSGAAAAPAPGDYAGCAHALREAGVPAAEFRRYVFSQDVAQALEDAEEDPG